MAAAGAVLPSRSLALRPGISHQFLWTVSQPIQFCDQGAVRQGARQKPRPSRVRSRASFGPWHRCSYPEGYGCYCTTSAPRQVREESPPPKGPAGFASGARNGPDAAWSGAGWQQPASPPSLGRRENRVTQLQVECSLRVKRSDPSHGANAQPKAAAVPVVKVPVRIRFL